MPETYSRRCPACGSLNRKTLEECFICGFSFVEEDLRAAKDKAPGPQAAPAVAPLASKAKKKKPSPKEDAKQKKPKPKEEAARSKPKPKEAPRRDKPRPHKAHAKGGPVRSLRPALEKIVLFFRAVVLLFFHALRKCLFFIAKGVWFLFARGKELLAVIAKGVWSLFVRGKELLVIIAKGVWSLFVRGKELLVIIAKGVRFLFAGGKGLLLLFRKNPATLALLAIVTLVIWFKCDASGPRWMQTAFDSVSNDLKRVVSRGIDAVTPRGSPAADPRWDGPYLVIQEPLVPGFPIMVVSMPTRAVCTEFLSRFEGAAKLSGRCIPNEGQYDSFFRHEPNRDWYVTLQPLGELEAVNIFRSGDPEHMLETVRWHTKKMLELMRQPSSHSCTVHVISPQGEIDMAESTSTIQALIKGDRALHRATWSERE